MLLIAALFVIAVAYSSVGHAGASGYIAVLTLAGFAAAETRPAALALNLVVGGIGLWRFAGARRISWRSVLPLVLASAPMVWIGARLQLAKEVYAFAIAGVLVLSALALLRTAASAAKQDATIAQAHVPWASGLFSGGVIGVLSGITGTGGAIFLTPLLLARGWAATRDAAGISVAFVLVNSVVGLAGLASAGFTLPAGSWAWLPTVAAGALLGTQFGLKVLPVSALRMVLAAVLLVAAAKLVFT